MLFLFAYTVWSREALVRLEKGDTEEVWCCLGMDCASVA